MFLSKQKPAIQISAVFRMIPLSRISSPGSAKNAANLVYNNVNITNSVATIVGIALRFASSIGLTPAILAQMIPAPATGDMVRPNPAPIWAMDPS